MILEMRQTDAEGMNRFLICEDEQELFLGESHRWTTGRRALSSDREKELWLRGTDGSQILTARYGEVQPEEAEDLPEQWLSGTGVLNAYRITDGSGEPVGAIYPEQRALKGGRIVLEYHGTVMYAFPIYDETREVISFYIGKVQVGQITRPIASRDHRDTYWLHFLPYYDDWAAFLSMFTLCYDFLKHNGSDEQRKNSELKQVFMGDQNRDTYHPDFIETYFGNAESLQLEAVLEDNAREMTEGMKTEVKQFGSRMLILWGIATAVLLAVLWRLGL